MAQAKNAQRLCVSAALASARGFERQRIDRNRPSTETVMQQCDSDAEQ